MRVLLLGAGGMLATDLVQEAPGHVELIARSETEIDITDAGALQDAVMDGGPHVIINAAAYTDVDGAEAHIQRAFAVNGHAMGVIGTLAREVGATVVHYGTDYVFDGTARDPYPEGAEPTPLGVYGASKLLGERELALCGARYVVVRTQWLFGPSGRSFPRTMWERAVAGSPTRVVNDQFGRPTYTTDLARATWAIVESASAQNAAVFRHSSPGSVATGMTVHVANQGVATWHDLAQRIFAHCGCPELLTPCTTAEYPTPAKRPVRSVLDTSKYERIWGRALPPWTDAVDRFLHEIGAVTSKATEN